MEEAVERFTDRGLQNVSISEIATAAHCSITTIYDAFLTKEELFEQALNHGMANWPPPFAELPESDAQAFEALLNYCLARMAYFSHPKTRALMLTGFTESRRIQEPMQKLVQEHDPISALTELVEACMRAGYLHPSDVEAVAHCVFSGVSFVPMVDSLRRVASREAPMKLARKVLRPFVTALGAASLQSWEAAMAASVDAVAMQ
jgi:AcrR family transcriptional regulator